MSKNELGKKLKTYREKNKLSIEDLSKKIKVSESKINKWENGKKKPSLFKIKKLSNLYNIKLYNLVDEKELLDEMIVRKRLDIIEFFVILLLIIFIILSLSFIASDKDYENNVIYEFEGESENFKLNNGRLIVSDKTRYIDMSNFEIKSKNKYTKLIVNIAFNESIWEVAELADDMDAKEWIGKLSFSEYSLNKQFLNKDTKLDSFIEYIDPFPNDFKIEFNYCIEDDCGIEILDVKSRERKLKK